MTGSFIWVNESNLTASWWQVEGVKKKRGRGRTRQPEVDLSRNSGLGQPGCDAHVIQEGCGLAESGCASPFCLSRSELKLLVSAGTYCLPTASSSTNLCPSESRPISPLNTFQSILFFSTMSTLEDLDDLEREQKEERKDDGDKDKDNKKKSDQNGDAEMKDAEAQKEDDLIDDEIYSLSTQDILTRKRLLENDARIMKSEFQRLSHEKATMAEKIRDNLEKIENNR